MQFVDSVQNNNMIKVSSAAVQS